MLIFLLYKSSFKKLNAPEAHPDEPHYFPNYSPHRRIISYDRKRVTILIHPIEKYERDVSWNLCPAYSIYYRTLSIKTAYIRHRYGV